MGRLDTRYAPVRRSPSEIASNLHAAPRLACVKPVASVHPEPGSNSSLYMYCILVLCFAKEQKKMKIHPAPIQDQLFDIHFSLDFNKGITDCSLTFPLCYFPCLCSLSMNSFLTQRGTLPSFAGAKVRQLCETAKYFTNFFQKIFIPDGISARVCDMHAHVILIGSSAGSGRRRNMARGAPFPGYLAIWLSLS